MIISNLLAGEKRFTENTEVKGCKIVEEETFSQLNDLEPNKLAKGW